MKRFGIMIILLAIVFAFPAYAATGKENIDSLGAINAAVMKVFSGSMFDRFKDAGIVIANSYLGYAKGLAGLLLLMTLTWDVILNMKDEKSPLSGLIENLLYGSIVVFLISIYSSIVDDVAALGLYVTSAGGSNGLPGEVVSLVGGYFTLLINIIKSAFSSIVDSYGLGLVQFILDAIAALILGVIALIFGVFALAEVVGVAFMGPVLFALGVALGPLFIATLASSWTRRWFDQWINFMVGAALLTGVLTIVLKILNTVLINTFTGSIPPGSSLIGPMLVVTLFSMSLAKIIAAVPSYADALFPGRTGANKGSSSSNDMAKNLLDKGGMAQNLFNKGKGAKDNATLPAKLNIPL